MPRRRPKETPMLRFQNAVRGSRTPRRTLAIARQALPVPEYEKGIRWLIATSGPGREMWPRLSGLEIGHFFRALNLSPIDVTKEIAWCGAILRIFGDQLKRFASMSRLYEPLLLKGEYSQCEKVLDEIDSTFGMTIWSIELRLALLQRWKGLQQQKDFSSTIRANRSDRDMLNFLVFYISQRNEENVRANSFVERMSSHTDKQNVSSAQKAYVKYRLVGRIPDSNSEIASILAVESTSSVFDLYETFITMLQAMMLSEDADDHISVIAREAQALLKLTADDRLAKLLFAIQNEISLLEDVPARDISADDELLAGNLSEALQHASDLRETQVENTSAWFVEVIAASELENDLSDVAYTLAEDIIKASHVAVRKLSDVDDAVAQLYKICLNHRLLRFPEMLKYRVWYETNAAPLANPVTMFLAALKSHYLEPILLSALKDGRNYEHRLREEYGSSLAVAVIKAEQTAGEKLPSRLSPANRLILETEDAFRRRKFEDALSLARARDESLGVRANRIAARLESHCLIALGRESEAIAFMVTAALMDPLATAMLPIELGALSLKNEELRHQLRGQLSTPIILHLQSEYEEDEFGDLRDYAYEDFLLYFDLKRPSELRSILSNFDRTLLIYFLKNICIPDVMELSVAFENTREVEDERLAICALLSEIDSANAKAYESEIREITRAQTIWDAVRHAEQSKITVDVPALRRWADQNLKEGFTRYKALRSLRPRSRRQMARVLGTLIEGGSALHDFLEIPEDEAFELLSELVSSMVSEATRDSEYGLDCYLSIRVRHGTLSGQLRAPLEEQQLLTQRESGSLDYKPNPYWPKVLNLAAGSRQTLDRRLAAFSRAYDAMVEQFAKEQVQVRSETRPLGLFSERLSLIDVHLLSAAIGPDTSFDEFIDACFRLFWRGVDASLTDVRKYIDDFLKVRVADMFLEFEADIENIGGRAGTADLARAIRTAQTGVQNALDRVKDWFRLSQPLDEPALTISEMIDVGVSTLKRLHPDFNPVVNKTVPNITLAHSLSGFTDILFIVFDNIYKHSGMSDPSIDVHVTEERDRLHVRVESDVIAGRAGEGRRKVREIKERIDADNYQVAVSLEGGTGFIKLRRLITGPVNDAAYLDFGFVDDQKFFIEMHLRLLSEL